MILLGWRILRILERNNVWELLLRLQLVMLDVGLIRQKVRSDITTGMLLLVVVVHGHVEISCSSARGETRRRRSSSSSSTSYRRAQSPFQRLATR